MNLSFLFILFSWYSLQVDGQRHDFSISGLLKEQSVVINFNSSGCFNNNKYEIHICPTHNIYSSDSSAIIIVYDVSDSNHKEIAKYAIAKYYLICIDGWIQYYRAHPEGGCTSIDAIELVWKERNDTIYTEKYVDGSCLSAMSKNKLFSIWDLIQIGNDCNDKKAARKLNKKNIKCIKSK